MLYDFDNELRGGDDEPMNAKQGGIGQALLVGIIVGLIVGLMNLAASKSWDKNDTLVELKTKVEYLTTAVNKLTEQPYVRRDEFQAGIATIEGRLTGFDRRVDQLEQRASRESGRARP